MTGAIDAFRPLVCGAAAVGLVAAAGSPAVAAGKKAYSATSTPTPAISTPALSKLPGDEPEPSAGDRLDPATKTRPVGTPAAKRAAAIKRWTTLAAHGDARAQLKLGRAYRCSKNTRANTRKALHWLRAAARANIPAAHYQLGLLYMAGMKGKLPNLVEAYARFKIASEGGDGRATALVFYIGVRMTADELRRAHERIADIRRFEIAPATDPTDAGTVDAATTKRAARMPAAGAPSK